MKKALLAFCMLVCLLAPPGVQARPVLDNGIAVIVNETVITYKDVQGQLLDDIEFLERRYGSQPQVLEQKISELQRDKIEELVEYQLVLHEFNTAGYQLPESYIQNRINDDIKKYGDRLTLTKTLQARGGTFESYRQKVRERTILELMWRQKVPTDPLVSPLKIETYYSQNKDKFGVEDQVKLRMIVLTNKPAQLNYSPMKMGAEILAKLKEGASFTEMAKLYSNGSQAVAGGDWGWVEKKVLREDLAKIAFTMKAGERSDLIETPQGVYIMLVEDIKAAHVKALGEVREEIETTLKGLENRRLRKQWIDRLKQKQFVRYY